MTGEEQELREAERQAKAGRLRLWREYVPPQASAQRGAHSEECRGVQRGAEGRRGAERGGELCLFRVGGAARALSLDWPPPATLAHPTTTQAASELLGRVVEVVSGDTLVVADAANNETRYSLSSIRCPRMGREPEPYAAEAKEALRRRVLCERVRQARSRGGAPRPWL